MAFAARLVAQDAPPGLLRGIAARETATEKARNDYTWRQTAMVQELDSRGAETGHYREVRDILFSSEGKRIEQMAGSLVNTLRRLQLTAEDFRDLRDIQPLMLNTAALFMYESKFRGDETVAGVDCWVLGIEPRQILYGQRLFEGTIWADKADLSIVKTEGRAVPQEHGGKHENLFPHFVTVRRKVDGRYWFPAETLGDDTLAFSSGLQRERLTVLYENYQRFSSESTVKFGP